MPVMSDLVAYYLFVYMYLWDLTKELISVFEDLDLIVKVKLDLNLNSLETMRTIRS